MRRDDDRPVLPWRLIVGICLHFAVPAYLLFLLAALLLSSSPPTGAEQAVRWTLQASGRFILAFIALTVAAGVIAALIDPLLRRLRDRRHSRHPDQAAIASRQRAETALARIDATQWDSAGAMVAAAVQKLRREPWNHQHPDGQRLSRDLQEAADVFIPALESARGNKRAEIADLAAQALTHIATALERLARDKSKLDEGDARTIAHLIDLRYGDNDLPVSLERRKDRE